MERGEESKMAEMKKLPKILIQNKGRVTKVFVDGEELNGVKSVSFSHNARDEGLPDVNIELTAEQICLETAQIFALPEVYHPYYVSSDKLIELGVLTRSQFEELLNKELL